jgi:hypothetical protein
MSNFEPSILWVFFHFRQRFRVVVIGQPFFLFGFVCLVKRLALRQGKILQKTCLTQILRKNLLLVGGWVKAVPIGFADELDVQTIGAQIFDNCPKCALPAHSSFIRATEDCAVPDGKIYKNK